MKIIKPIYKFLMWIITPHGSFIFWKKCRGVWVHYTYTKKWWVIEKHYLDGKRVWFYTWWRKLIF